MKDFLKTTSCIITCLTVMTFALFGFAFAEDHAMGCLPPSYDDLFESKVSDDLQNAGYDVTWRSLAEDIDVDANGVTIPSRRCVIYTPIDKTFDEIKDIFSNHGFVVTLDEFGDESKLCTNDNLIITKPENNQSGFTWRGTIIVRGDCVGAMTTTSDEIENQWPPKGDGIIDISDVVFLRNLLVNDIDGEYSNKTHTNILDAADYNADLHWDISDLVQMRSFIVNNQ